MFRIWGKDVWYTKNQIIEMFGDASIVTQAEKRGGVKVGDTKILYYR